MTRTRSTSALIVLVAAATTIAVAGSEEGGAPPEGSYDLSWFSIDGGGATFSTGGGFELGGTIGQHDAPGSQPMSGGGPEGFSLTGGFWSGVGASGTIDPCLPDITGDLLINVDDLLAVINSWGPCADCAADIAPPPLFDDVVNIDDLLAVINAWGTCG